MRMIWRAVAAITAFIGLAGGAGAQTPTGQPCPYIASKAVLTAAQWNYCFQIKQDVLGFAPVNRAGDIMSGPLVTAPSGATTAGFNLPHGVAPTVPNNGDLWTTTGGLFVRINGVTVGPLIAGTSAGFAATSPITVSFPSGIVTYAFDLTVANTFLAPQTSQGATTTQPGWYAQITGDTVPRAHFGISAVDVPTVSFGPGNAARDLFLQRAGPASLRIGAADAAAPVAQNLSVQNVVTGTSNTAGAALTVNGSQGTGTGAGGNITFRVAPAGSTGTAQNALVQALTISGGAGGVTTAAATDQGLGTLNLAGNLFNNGTAPTGTGGYVRATSPSLVTPALGVATATSLAINGATLGASNFVVSGSSALTSNSASAFTVGANGATNPGFQVDTSTALVTAGLSIKAAATGGTVALSAIDSGGTTNVSIDAKGSGTITLAGTSTGTVSINHALTYGGVTLANSVTGTGSMVLATSPTFVTPNLGTPASGTISTGVSLGGVTMALGSDATGDVYYRNAGGVLTRLPVGSNGQVLTLATGIPSWATVSGTGTITSVTPGGGMVSSTTASCSQTAITTVGTLSKASCVNAQVGTSYAVADGDRAKLITAVNAAAQAYSIAQAGIASNFFGGWYTDIHNNSTNVAGIVTITPATSTIDGNASIKIYPGNSARIVSDGTNYFTAFTDTQGWTTFTPNLTCGTATFSLVSAHSKNVGSKSTLVQIDFSISTLGTCGNAITFTLPNTAQTGGSFLITAVSVMGGCAINPGSSTATCSKTTAAAFVAAEHYVGSGVYENQ